MRTKQAGLRTGPGPVMLQGTGVCSLLAFTGNSQKVFGASFPDLGTQSSRATHSLHSTTTTHTDLRTSTFTAAGRWFKNQTVHKHSKGYSFCFSRVLTLYFSRKGIT